MKDKITKLISAVLMIAFAGYSAPLKGYLQTQKWGQSPLGTVPIFSEVYDGLRPLAAGEARPAAEHEKWLLEKPQEQIYVALMAKEAPAHTAVLKWLSDLAGNPDIELIDAITHLPVHHDTIRNRARNGFLEFYKKWENSMRQTKRAALQQI